MRWGSALTILLVLVWPLLALPATVFSKGYFTFWTIIAIVWGLVASAAMIFMPAAESAGAIVTTFKNMAAGNKTVREADELDSSAHADTTHDGKKAAAKLAEPNGKEVNGKEPMGKEPMAIGKV